MTKSSNEIGVNQFSHDHLRDAMRIIEEAYAETCASLKVSSPIDSLPSPVSALNPDTFLEIPKAELEAMSLVGAETDEDTDWFFATDEPEMNLSVPDNIYGSMYGNVDEESDSSEDTSLCNDPAPIDTRGLVSANLFSRTWLAAGLQHCLPFDFALQRKQMDSPIALPMHLAMQVKNHLFEDMVKSKHNESDPLFEMSHDEGSLKGVLQTHMHVHKVPGLSAHRCRVYSNALLLSCAMRDMDRARSCCQYTMHNSDNIHNTTNLSSNAHAQTTEVYVFQRTVVLQANIGLIGQHFVETNSALGNSQQARSINVTKTMSGDMYLQSLQNTQLNEQQKYVHKICAILKTNKVDLVLCEVGMLTAELLDTLSTHNITILPIATTKELNSAADLCDATVLDDIVGMCEQDIGMVPLQLQYLLQLPSITVPPGTLEVKTENSDTPESVAKTDGLEGKECLVVLSRYDHTKPGIVSNSKTDVHPSSSSSSSSGTDMEKVFNTQLIEETPAAPISVLICAPTEAMALATEDKFHQCLHRLRAVCEDNDDVMVGGGLPELLTVLRLDEIKTTLFSSKSYCNDANSDATISATEKTYHLCAIIECFQRCLKQYVLCILMNNGFSFAEGTERIQQVTNALTQLHREYREIYYGCTRIHSYIAALSLEEKLALPKPIDLHFIYEDPALQHVLDPVQLKVNTVQIACSLLLQLNSIKFV